MSYQVEENVGCFYYSCSFNIWFVLLLIGFWIFSAIHNSFFEASLVKEIGNAGVLKNLPNSSENCKIPLAVTEANLLYFRVAQQSKEPETSKVIL
jgi:dipeptide/tripeptide permease